MTIMGNIKLRKKVHRTKKVCEIIIVGLYEKLAYAAVTVTLVSCFLFRSRYYQGP